MNFENKNKMKRTLKTKTAHGVHKSLFKQLKKSGGLVGINNSLFFLIYYAPLWRITPKNYTTIIDFESMAL